MQRHLFRRPKQSDAQIIFSPIFLCRTSWISKRQLPHYLSLCILLISREYRSITLLLLPAVSSSPLASLLHSFCSPSLAIFFLDIASFSFIFNPFSPMGHWSIWLLPTPLNSSVFYLFIFLFCFCFLPMFHTEYHQLIRVSFLFSFSFLCIQNCCSLPLSFSLPHRSSRQAVCQDTQNLCQAGGTHGLRTHVCFWRSTCTWRFAWLCLGVCVACFVFPIVNVHFC